MRAWRNNEEHVKILNIFLFINKGMELRLPAELRGMVNLSGTPDYTNYTLHKGMDDEGGLEVGDYGRRLRWGTVEG